MKKFLHIFIFIVLAMTLFCIGASAASDTWTDKSGRTWNFNYFEETVDGVTVRTATITGASLKPGETTRTSELNIPSKVYVNGSVEYTVTKIGNSAFACSDSFTTSNATSKKYFGHVTLPDTLVEIGEYAFKYSAIYGEIAIPESVTTIGKGAFLGCVGLDTVTFPSSLDTVPQDCFNSCKALVEFKTAGTITTFKAYSFKNCQSLLYIDISEEVVAIESEAFLNCYCLSKEFNFPVIETLGTSAFSNCYFVTGVTIGSNCKFSYNAFSGCSDLKYYNVAEENQYYCSVDGVLYSDDMKTLYRYPLGSIKTEYVIPDSVTLVEDSAFYGASNLKNIVVGKGVTKINGSAFRKTGITSLYIPDNVTSLGGNVASECSSLVWVVFGKGITSFREDYVSKYATLKHVFSTLSGGGSGGLPGDANTGSQLTYYISDRYCDVHYSGHMYGYLDYYDECDGCGTEHEADACPTPDCEKSKVTICCFCGETTVNEPVGHVGQILRSTKLTCTTNEAYYVNCINCKNPEAEVIVAKCVGHTLTEASEAEESTYGYSYSKCTVCGEIALNSFETNAYTGGDVNGDGTIDSKDVTLLGKILGGSASSANKFACDVNNDGVVTALDLLVLKQYVAELGATIEKNTNTCDKHVHVTTVAVTRESCAYGGKYVSFCADCGAKIEGGEKTTSPTGHFFTESVIEGATCTKEGKVSRVCSICQYSDEAITPMLEHTTPSWWMLSDNEVDYQYCYCTVCKVLQSREVDRSILQDVVATIPESYNIYCTTESAALLRPIMENSKKALTQEQVDVLIEEIRTVLPTVQYNVTDIPVIYLESKLDGKNYVDANIVVAYKDENGDLQSLTDSEGQMRVRGNYTASFSAKLPFNIKFSRKVDLFGMGEGKKYHLLANAYDQTTIRNALAFEFAESLGLEYTCKYQFVEVYHNGVYRGCYMLVTPIDIGEDRVDIDEEKDVIIHLSFSNGGEDAPYNSPIFGFSYIRLEEPSEYSPYTRAQMMRIMYQLDFAILSGDTDEMEKYMDVDSMIRYFVFHEYVKDTDVVWDSTRFYIEDGKLHGGPVWDLDISQGNVPKKDGNLGSNNYLWFRDSNGDGKSDYNYEGSGVTDAELNALGEYRSAVGTWASTRWAKHYRQNNNTSDAYCFRWWFYYLDIYSEEFMVEVAEFIRDNQEIFENIYLDSVDPETDAVVRCTIDQLAYGEAGEAITRNFVDASSGPIYNLATVPDAVDYLRTWWKIRNEWVTEYYTETYLSTPAS